MIFYLGHNRFILSISKYVIFCFSQIVNYLLNIFKWHQVSRFVPYNFKNSIFWLLFYFRFLSIFCLCLSFKVKSLPGWLPSIKMRRKNQLNSVIDEKNWDVYKRGQFRLSVQKNDLRILVWQWSPLIEPHLHFQSFSKKQR